MPKSLVFVYIGKSIPKYVSHSLELARRHSGVPLTLICSKSAEFKTSSDINNVYLEDFYNSERFESLANGVIVDPTFRQGFWLKTLERFFVLESFGKVFKENSFFHAELDQIVFRLDQVSKQPGLVELKGLSIPFHLPNLPIASLVVVSDLDGLSSFTSFVEQQGTFENEMLALGDWSQSGLVPCNVLPSLATKFHSREWKDYAMNPVLDVEKMGGIFDPAQLGQWLLGIDPRNVPLVDKPWNRFVDPWKQGLLSASDLESLSFRFDAGSSEMFVKHTNGEELRLYNLHIHSKLHKFLNRKKGIYQMISWANSSVRIVPPSARLTQLLHLARHYVDRVISNPEKFVALMVSRVNQALGRRPTSEPYISGDTLRAICQWRLEKRNQRIDYSKISAGQVVFCETELFEELISRLNEFKAPPVVIVCGNSDQDISKSKALAISKGRGDILYIQNLNVALNNAVPIPIGLENKWRFHHGKTSQIENLRKERITKRFRIFWSFNIQTNLELRRQAAKALSENSIADGYHNLSTSSHRNLLSKYAFVAAPSGNGIDTHRVWEALYLRTVPIVTESTWSRWFQEKGLPIWVVSSYDYLRNLNEADLETKYAELLQKFDSSLIWVDYWVDLIQGSSRTLNSRFQIENEFLSS